MSALAKLAAVQHGAVGRAQVLNAGFSRHSLDRMVSSGALARFLPRVYTLWTPRTASERWRQRLFAAALWLGEGSSVSHRAAALIRRLDGIVSAPVELSTLSTRRSRSGIIVHNVATLPDSDIELVEGIPVTSVDRTLIDLAGVVSVRVLEQAYHSALRRNLTTAAALWVRAAVEAPPLHALLTEGGAATESMLETLVWQALRDSGLPLPERQYNVYDNGRFVGRVDFAYPDLMIVIEADGYDPHAPKKAFQKDRARQNDLILQRWAVLRVTWEDITERPQAFVSAVAALLADRTARVGQPAGHRPPGRVRAAQT